jgi:serine/threonine protein kinase
MNNDPVLCDPERIELFLQQKLSDGEQAAFESHLDNCDECRRRLEAAAAGDDVWSGVRDSLLGEPMPPECPRSGDATLDAPPGGDATAGYRTVLSLLTPTDDERMLGRLGTYEVVGVIGWGGMGVVLKAFDAALNRYVAIKVLAPHLANSGAARKRFSREAQAAAAVVHDNVMEIYGVAEARGLSYLVMPYVRGPSLQRRLDDNGPLALAEILRIGMQAAAGLAAAHAQGLVHRDVKPANILLADGVERVKLTDFGLARAVDDASLTRTGVIAGTPQYMSPEQARGESVDPRSDLFSLGSVLYAMCTGRAPFRAETSYGVLRRITDEEPRPICEINPEIPEWLCWIVAKLMAKRPADRFRSAREVAELLEQCLAHVQQPTVVALPASLAPLPRGRRFSIPRHRLGVLAMIAAGFCALSVFFWQATDPPGIAGRWTGEGWGQVVLHEQEPGKYEGDYTGTVGEEPGKLQLEWSRIERRFNGTWTGAKDRFGKMSVRLVGDEIRGAWTTSKKSGTNPGTPELADLSWTRSGEPPQIPPQLAATSRLLAWQQSEPYIAPNFNTFFPDDADGGLALNRLWNADDGDSRTDREILETVRKGLRRTKEHRTSILRWIGNKYIWGQTPQNPNAIEIMYHAADFSGPNADPHGTRHYAVYFGLSVVQPKTPTILRTLAELCVRVDDPNDLQRIAWGTKDQWPELLEFLKPFLSSRDRAVRSKAELCRKMFSGEIEEYAWLEEQVRLLAINKFGHHLPEIKRTLTSGSSEKRRNTLEWILMQQEQVSLLLDDSFLAAFAKCAEDPDPCVRSRVAVIAGDRWVRNAQQQNAEAIKLMFRLSKDENANVRYDARYYGLSRVRNKSDEVVHRLQEMVSAESKNNRPVPRIMIDRSTDRTEVPPATEAQRAIARLVLVFFRDNLRRSIPAVLVSAGTQTLAVTAGPATVIPDKTPAAIDRAFLEFPGRPAVKAEYVSSTKELCVYRAEGRLTSYHPDNKVALAAGDVLSAIIPDSSSELAVTPNAARVVALDRQATLPLPKPLTKTHHFDRLVEIDRSLPEGTPLFKDGKLAGLTLLGRRFLGETSNKSYVVPVDRIAALCSQIESAGGLPRAYAAPNTPP